MGLIAIRPSMVHKQEAARKKLTIDFKVVDSVLRNQFQLHNNYSKIIKMKSEINNLLDLNQLFLFN